MLARPTQRLPTDRESLAKPKAQTRPSEERFLLRVDGQNKRSFSSKEAATTAGIAIKKAYPVVVVTVFDSQEHTTELIKV
jgi:hypothetical protein